MRHFAAVLIVSGIAGATPAAAADPKEPEHCAQLVTILQTAVDRIVQGDFSAKVQVALAAHERLNCDPEGLLQVLRVRKPKEPVTRR